MGSFSIGVMILTTEAADQRTERIQHLERSFDMSDSRSRSPLGEDAKIPTEQSPTNGRRHSKNRGRKTPKRAAAEAALADRYSPGDAEGGGAAGVPKRLKTSPKRSDALYVPGCRGGCDIHKGHSGVAGWCNFGVSLQHTNWSGVMASMHGNIPRPAQGNEGRTFDLEQGVSIIVVNKLTELGPALERLKESKQDELISIDLEWRPTFSKGAKSRVAMVQLASSSLAVLIRTCMMKSVKCRSYLQDFLSDPAHVVVGFGWDSSDEQKLSHTFGFGRAVVPRFLDLQSISAKLGYGNNIGLAKLTQQVMGIHIPKDKKITMGNWEAEHLTPKQLLYAAMDALITGELLRALRLWHSHPSECAACSAPLGTFPSQASVSLPCPFPGCRKTFLSRAQRDAHALAAHRLDCKCQSCGRLTAYPQR